MEAKLAYNREEFSHPSHATLRTHKSACSDFKRIRMTRGSTHQRFSATLLWNRPFSFTGIKRARVYFVYSYDLLPRNAFAASESETPQCHV